MKGSPIPILKMASDNNLCLSDLHVIKLGGMRDVPVFKVKVIIINEVKERLVSLVEIKGNAIYWADCFTGSLFDHVTGRCLTSSQLRMIGVPVRLKNKYLPKLNKEINHGND